MIQIRHLIIFKIKIIIRTKIYYHNNNYHYIVQITCYRVVIVGNNKTIVVLNLIKIY